MTFFSAWRDHPDLTDEQRKTFVRLVRRFGAPFACSLVASNLLPTWQNIGTVSISPMGNAITLHDRNII